MTDLEVRQSDTVLRVTFNRPEKHNALTSEMYDALADACRRANEDATVRAMILTGAGEKSFVAGTDISEFLGFVDGEDGVRYERRITAVLDTLEQVQVPTIAAISGHCMGGGLALATACDLRLATASSRFGYPIARTLGNCLSVSTLASLTATLGEARAKTLLLLGQPMTATEAHSCGFVSEIVAKDDLADRADSLAESLTQNAPLTMWAAKEALRRLRSRQLPDDEDIVRRVYGSEDFRSGVRDFLAKRPHEWTGR